jgi:acetyl-CoA carboxylase biotin carboxyl carrier protein
MTFKEIQELIALMNKSSLTEFKMQDKDFKITIRTGKYVKGKSASQPMYAAMPQQMQQPVMQSTSVPTNAATPVAVTAPASPSATAETKDSNVGLLQIKSPIVGTFYRTPSPDKPIYVKVGDKVEKGKVVCIVEAMKLFNEIESEVSGTIVKVCVDDASPVEYDQVLFLVDPKG